MKQCVESESTKALKIMVFGKSEVTRPIYRSRYFISIYFVAVTLHDCLLWEFYLLTVRIIFCSLVEVFDIKGNYGNFQMHFAL